MVITFASLHAQRSAQAVPLAAGCLAAALPASLGQTSRLVDLFPDESPTRWRDKILFTRPDLVALSLYSWNRHELLALTRELRRHQPQLLLVAGGPEASGSPLKTLREGALDGVILGEGEETFAHLAAERNNFV